MIEIQEIREDWQAAEAEKLAWEFVDWLRGRYPEMQTEIDDYLAGQKFAERMKDVRKDYGPPRGEGLLALLDGKPVGLLLMRDIGDHACEMNRMFVRPEARGKGVARLLADQLIEIARVKGFEWMRLGALPRHDGTTRPGVERLEWLLRLAVLAIGALLLGSGLSAKMVPPHGVPRVSESGPSPASRLPACSGSQIGCRGRPSSGR